MKKFASVFFAFFFLHFFLSAQNSQSEISLYNELSSAYNSGFYPGTIQYAQNLLSKFPDSAFYGNTLCMYGESLVRVGQYKAAITQLNLALQADSDLNLKKDAVFWLARSYDLLKNDDEALSYYYEYCAQNGAKSRYYPVAILYSALVYYRQQEYKKAVPNFEFCVSNGNLYAPAEYYDALLKYADSCNKSGSPKKTISLYDNLTSEQNNTIPQKVFYVLTEYAGDAYALQKNYKKAYELYVTVLSGPEQSLAANALKKAYNVSANHRREVGAEPGTVLQNAQDSLKENPELLAEFWVRLGTDAFYEGDYRKASSYFDESDAYNSESLLELVSMYRAEIALAGSSSSADSASAADSAEKLLLDAQKKQNLMEEPLYKDEYAELLAKYAAIQQHWKDVLLYTDSIAQKNERVTYYRALAEYHLGDYATASSMLTESSGELYALSLARRQKLKESAAAYKNTDDSVGLTAEERLNYAKVLLLSGRYSESQIQAAKCGLSEGQYVLGLAQFNTRSWPYAEESFLSYIRSFSKGADKNRKKNLSYAQFYLGYSRYRQGKADSAYKTLSDFVRDYPNHELSWNAMMSAANAAVQSGNYTAAVKMAENAVKSASNTENREEAVLLCAEIHSDSGRYSNALSLLEPYTKLKTDFGMRAMYQTALVYEKMQDYSSADARYKEIATQFPNAKTAEEAMYRRGELFYSTEDYSSALTRFNEYSSKYPNGSFVAAAWYYAADCLSKTGNESRAVLQNQALVKKFPESPYVYSATKNLIDLYRNQQKYSEALESARFLLSKYGDQARDDGIAEVASQLEKLSSGKSESIVKKEAEFNRAGGLNTPEGRAAGTELVRLYAADSSTSQDAVRLAEKLLPLQKKNKEQESLFAAMNADILAIAYHQQDKNKLSAENFLFAAECYRMNEKSDEAASALYGAYDAFISAGLRGDANETARTLKQLYPASRQARSVKTDN